jgi:hypothetical protein
LKRDRWLFLFAAVGAICALAAFLKVDVFTVANLFGVGQNSNVSLSLRDVIIIIFILSSLCLSGLGFYLSKDGNVLRLSRAQKRNSSVNSRQDDDFRGEIYSPAAPSDIFEIIEASPEVPPANVELNWKRKLRVILRNASDKKIEVHAPDWICRGGYVGFQSEHGFWSTLEPEDVAAGGYIRGKWGKETQRLSVAQNEVFRVGVGLDPIFSIEDIKSRQLTRRVGVLIIPLVMGDQRMEWRHRV